MDWLLEQWSAPRIVNGELQYPAAAVLSYTCEEGPYHWTDEDGRQVNGFYTPSQWEIVLCLR